MRLQEHIYNYNKYFQLEAGSSLPGFQLKYTTMGKLNPRRSNVIWVCHALTADSNFMNWWEQLFREGEIFDVGEYFIICANVLGGCYGSTGPLSLNPVTNQPYYYSFPQLTNRDVTHAFDLLRIHLGIDRIHTLIGGSLGGQQAIEWAILRPEVFRFVIPIACNALHSPWGIAINESQRMAIEADPSWGSRDREAGIVGLKVARAISMTTFRTYEAYKTQADEISKIDDYKASSYQQYHGNKLASRFTAFSYFTLSKMMDSHHVGRGQASVEEGLKRIQASVLVIGIDSDLLFPLSEQEFLSDHIPSANLKILQSGFGHDAFLIEVEKINYLIKNFIHKESKQKIHV